MRDKGKKIAVDFDGVIVRTHPTKGQFGSLIPGVMEAFREMRSRDYYIVIWTAREDISSCRRFLDDNQIPYNELVPKVSCDVYLDDQ